MIDSLWALGQRLESEGFDTPLKSLRLAHQYESLEEAIAHVARVGEMIRHRGFPEGLRPLLTAFLGSGNVSKGAQEVFERLPIQEIEPEEIESLGDDRDWPRNVLYKVVLSRRDRVERVGDGGYDPEEYAKSPGLYRSRLRRYLPYLTMVVNCIFWEADRPVHLRAEDVRALWAAEKQPKLRVVGDITCDISGSVELTVKSTSPGDPVFVWDPDTGEAKPGFAGKGVVVMAVDNLPCEIPVEASEHFGDSLMRFLPVLARIRTEASFEELDFPPAIKRAVILYRGELTPDYRFVEKFLGETR